MAEKTQNMLFFRKAVNFGYFLIVLATLAAAAYGFDASFAINNNATYTNSKVVTLSVYANNAWQCRYANTQEPFTSWEQCQALRPWVLTAGGGFRTVYMEVDNGSAIQSYSDLIILDATPPRATIIINNGAPATESQDVMIAMTFSDNLAGVSLCRYSNEDNVFTDWLACTSQRGWQLTSGNGAKRIYYQVMDNAGNIQQAFDDITLGVCSDNDADSYTTCQNDCNDNNPAINPGATEACNGIDDNCNLLVDELLNCGNNTTGNCTSSWTCGDWSSCSNSIQSRTCHDSNLCAQDKIETQSCTSPSTGGSGSGGGGSGAIYYIISTANTSTETEQQPSWECIYSDCVNGTGIKKCIDKYNSKNVYEENFKCKNTETLPVENEKSQNSGASDTIVQPSSWYIPLYVYIILGIMVGGLIAFSMYVYNYDTILLNQRAKSMDLMLNNKLRRMRK